MQIDMGKKLKIKIKKLSPESKIPSYSKQGDAGLDLTATSKEFDEHGNIVYGTSLAVEIPYGYVGLLFPRSSNAKYDLLNTNAVGVIDSGYRGEIMMKYKSTLVKDSPRGLEYGIYVKDNRGIIRGHIGLKQYNIGDRIGQLIIMPYPKIEFEEVEELTETERGEGSYGSTGR